jgi:drug/metabolite transporter (DMT)-like permease
MVLIVEQEIRINPSGVIWTIAAILTTSSAQIFFAPLQKKLGLDGLQLLTHTSPLLTFGSFLIIPLFENTKSLIQFNLTVPVVLSIVFSCLIAVAFNTSNYVILSIVSPLTYTVLSQVKTILIIVIGSYFFDTMPSRRMTLGVCLGLIGVVLYTYESQRQVEEKKLQQQQQQKSTVISSQNSDGNKNQQQLIENDAKL